MRRDILYTIGLLCVLHISVYGYCDPLGTVQSERVANYTMVLDLDHDKKMATGTSRIVWHNPSNRSVRELKMYMYLNSFKDMNSTWLKPTRGEVFGSPLGDREAHEWGFVNIDSLGIEGGAELTAGMRYVQEDGNKDDQSVLLIPLPRSVRGGDSIVLNLKFRAKLPKTIARSGYGGNDFHLFVHWYPKLGVYEQNLKGEWGWNCHQFMQSTEFYGDFGVYDVTMTCAQELVLGASGCMISETANTDGTKTIRYLAEDVIDFAWCVSPEFEEYFDQWEDVQIKLLVPHDHCAMADRYMLAIKHALQYFNDHLGRYPYPGITLMDPPFHSLRNGFMEYPTFATAGTVYGMPRWFRGSESLAVHEFAHQFFMGVLASNEKEEAWLDEGFVTYYEDRIMESLFSKHSSQIDVLGFKYGNGDLSRQEYVSMRDHSNTAIARPGWELSGDYKGIVYAKTASMLKTLENYIGRDQMDEMMRGYYEQYKFTHPRRADFMGVVEKYLSEHVSAIEKEQYLRFMNQCLDGSDTADYSIVKLNGNRVELQREGELRLPIVIEAVLENGESVRQTWQNDSQSLQLEYESDVVSVEIDPDGQFVMDLNITNNSYTQETNTFARYVTKGMSWVHHILQSTSFLL